MYMYSWRTLVLVVRILSFKWIGWRFFANAALQARSGYGWECSSPDGFALNSKWNEAEKYICNPLSGEVPMECLSAKTLSGRSFRNFTNRITMSAPLIYPSQPRQPQTNHFAAAPTTQENFVQFPIQGVKTLCFVHTYCLSICRVHFYAGLKHTISHILQRRKWRAWPEMWEPKAHHRIVHHLIVVQVVLAPLPPLPS